MQLVNRTTRFMTAALFMVAVFLISCKDKSRENLTEQEEREASEMSSESDAEAEVIFNGMFDNVIGVDNEVGLAGLGIFGQRSEGVGENARPGLVDSFCFAVKIIRASTTAPFPRTVIVDFGAGCLGRDGHFRKGKIVTTYTNSLREPGAKATTKFEDHYIDDIKVEGTYVVTNTGSSSQRQWTVVIEDAKLSKPNGNYTYWNSRKKFTQFEGGLTLNIPIDDAFKIEGSASGRVKRNNVIVAWKNEITEALVKRFNCRFIVKGKVRIAREALATTSQWAALLDYGNGNCDNKATVTINGVVREITLH